MADRTNSDVDRALEAFGGKGLKYHNFGTFEPRHGIEEVAPTLVSDDQEYDPFAVALPPPEPPPRPSSRRAQSEAASEAYPLLGAAVPDAAHMPIHASYDPAPPHQAFREDEAEDPMDVHETPAYAPLPRRARAAMDYNPPPPDLPPPDPYPLGRAAMPTPVAERGWVPPPLVEPTPPMPYPPAMMAPPPPPPAPPPPPLVERFPEPVFAPPPPRSAEPYRAAPVSSAYVSPALSAAPLAPVAMASAPIAATPIAAAPIAATPIAATAGGRLRRASCGRTGLRPAALVASNSRPCHAAAARPPLAGGTVPHSDQRAGSRA